ncbi:MAG: hypothetical protein ACLR0U_30185 [Enterocloster clostridioformis]
MDHKEKDGFDVGIASLLRTMDSPRVTDNPSLPQDEAEKKEAYEDLSPYLARGCFIGQGSQPKAGNQDGYRTMPRQIK